MKELKIDELEKIGFKSILNEHIVLVTHQIFIALFVVFSFYHFFSNNINFLFQSFIEIQISLHCFCYSETSEATNWLHFKS